MEQKKTMNLWQMIALVVLLAGVTISMFFPVLNPTGQKMVRYEEAFMEKYQDDEELGEKFKDELNDLDDERDKQIEKYDEQFEDIGGINFPISGMQFISGSFWPDEALKEIEKYQEKDEDKLSDSDKEALDMYAKYNAIRVVMTIVYFMPLIFIALYILAFCLRWNKNIMAIIGLCFSVIGLGITAIFYFFVPYFIKNSIADKMGSDYEHVALDAAKMVWKVFRGCGLLTTFILFLLILVMAIVTMAVGGNKNLYPIPAPEPIPVPDPMPIPDPMPVPDPVPVPVPTPEPMPVPEPIPQPSVQQLGRVRCIEGNANVPGYKFPQENKIIVGANPTRCQIVINGAPHVSNIHCSIRYNAQRNTYIVKDHSSNGTFVNGARLPKDQAMEYPAGTILSLADGSNKLRLGD